MKANSNYLLTFLLLFFNVNPSYSIQKGDTILVYFSDNPSINKQYYEVLTTKFPELNFKNIKDTSDFYSYIPFKVYNRMRSKYGRIKKQVGGIEGSASADTKPDTVLAIRHYYFFDISSFQIEEMNYQTGPEQKQIAGYSYHYSLDLNNCNQTSIDKKSLTNISRTRTFKTELTIPPGSMDIASDFINPVYIAMYLQHELKPIPFDMGDEDPSISPCDIKNTDTVYLSQLLSELPGYMETNSLKYFKHAHFKLYNYNLGNRYLMALKENRPFYFYYYSKRYKRYYIVDGRDFRIVYFYNSSPNRDGQKKKEVSQFSMFGDKCR